MTGAPFRELFVELPLELFEALRGIGEEAVRRAAKPRPAPKRPSPRVRWTTAVNAVAVRYGWREQELSLAVDRDAWKVVARLPCGHRHVIELDGRLDADATQEFAFNLIDALDKREHERSCYCVPRSP